MTNHPNRSKTRPVATCTDRAVILGHASTESDALAVLRPWAAEHGVSIAGAKLADVLIDLPENDDDRAIKAWIPIPA